MAVQKVLDARFHPKGLPQLVIGCNEAPNELLLFDLSSGSHRTLQGHACQIQAVEYAMDGDVILSCGGSTLKVWDATSASLLHSCGPGVAATATASASGNPWIACHRDKICALAVNQKMSYLAATSGASGDPRVILWDVRSSKPLAHLSPSFTLPPSRAAGQSAPVRVRMAMDALCFADDRWLVCGSDTIGTTPSTIVLWDTSRPSSSSSSSAPSASPAATPPAGASAARAGSSVFHMPAFSSFVTCVAANPTDSHTIIAGGGDGSVALFDSRIHKAVTRLSLGGRCE
ncbi:unnamed protein product, partial [Closterium sp. NIES-54]